MELRDYIRVLRKGWLLIVVATLLGVGAAAAYSMLVTPRYQTTTALFVSVQIPENSTTSELVQGGSYATQKVSSYVIVATSPRVLDPVIRDLDLEVDAGTLAKSISVSASLNTVVIEITASDANPQRAADIANAVAESFIDVVDQIEAPVGSSSSFVRMQSIQSATVPTAPYTPNVPLNLALGLLVGLAVGIGAAVLRGVLDTRINGVRDLELVTDRPVIGGIGFDPNVRKRPLIVQDDPKSARAEAFRVLRTNMQFLQTEVGSRAFVVTSSVQNEGKSTTVANLAIAIAETGATVVVVDGDLRRPTIADVLGLEGAVGLTDVLIGRVELDDVLQSWGRARVGVLPAGRIPPNPSELLGSRAMANVIDELTGRFDVVLIDAPPLLPVTDAAVLSRLAGGAAIVVVAATRVRRQQLDAAIRSLEHIGSKVLGLVVTMLPQRGPDAYGYAQYYQYYQADTSKDSR